MEKSTGRFAKHFKKVLEEAMTAGAGGALGPNAGGNFAPNASTSTDSYAPGDARVPKALGKVQSRLDSPKKKKKKKKKAIKKVVKVVDEENEEVKVVKVDDISNYM
jgi:hypothetical protein